MRGGVPHQWDSFLNIIKLGKISNSLFSCTVSRSLGFFKLFCTMINNEYSVMLIKYNLMDVFIVVMYFKYCYYFMYFKLTLQ